MGNFCGRKDIIENLDALWGKRVSSLVTCRGRRRIGKSTLIKRFAENSNARFIKIEGLRPEVDFTDEDERRAFAEQLAIQTRYDGHVPGNWLEAFKCLADQIDERRTVVLLDEVSWLANYDKAFAATLKIAWDNVLKGHAQLIFVICGSVSVWIRKNIIDNRAYYGRRSLDVVVPELSLADCARFWGERADRVSLVDILDVLSITGGVPRYLEEVIPSMSAAENIRRMAFAPNSILRKDFDEMFSDVITHVPKDTARVLESLVDGPLTGAEVAAKLGVAKNGRISLALLQLVESGLASRDIGKNPETGEEIRERRYRLSDNYVRFYLKCVRPAARTIDAGAFALARLSQLPAWNVHLGLAFENLIVNHYRELLPFLHLDDALVYSAAPYSRRATKSVRGFQVDLLLQTRKSQCIVEVKRQRRIGVGIIQEVSEKVNRIKRAPDCSVRSALVFEGVLDDVVVADGYFDAIIPFRKLVGL